MSFAPLNQKSGAVADKPVSAALQKNPGSDGLHLAGLGDIADLGAVQRDAGRPFQQWGR